MSKEQVSGSLTLSLGGLAAEVAGEVVTRLRAELQAMTGPSITLAQLDAMEAAFKQAWFEVDQMGAPHRSRAGLISALKVIGIETYEDDEPVRQPSPFVNHRPTQADPESAAEWFRREVNG